jgi:hypothetical protein
MAHSTTIQPFKIIVTEQDDLASLKTKIKGINQKIILMESDYAANNYNQILLNQKTNYIAQRLMEEGWKIDKVKYYKGNLFKVIMSNKGTLKTPQGEGYQFSGVP